MTRDEIQKLLGGYSTGTLTAGEEQALFAAALEDQELFDALAREQALRDLLRDPATRAHLLVALNDRRGPWWRWLQRPAVAGAMAACLAAVVGYGIWQGRSPAPPVLVAVNREPSVPPAAAALPAPPAPSETRGPERPRAADGAPLAVPPPVLARAAPPETVDRKVAKVEPAPAGQALLAPSPRIQAPMAPQKPLQQAAGTAFAPPPPVAAQAASAGVDRAVAGTAPRQVAAATNSLLEPDQPAAQGPAQTQNQTLNQTQNQTLNQIRIPSQSESIAVTANAEAAQAPAAQARQVANLPVAPHPAKPLALDGSGAPAVKWSALRRERDGSLEPVDVEAIRAGDTIVLRLEPSADGTLSVAQTGPDRTAPRVLMPGLPVFEAQSVDTPPLTLDHPGVQELRVRFMAQKAAAKSRAAAAASKGKAPPPEQTITLRYQ